MTNSIITRKNPKGIILKARFAILSIFLTLALALPMFGQHTNKEMKKIDKNRHNIMKMMGKTIFESSAQGLHYDIWLITQEEHKRLMSGKMGQLMMVNQLKDSMEKKGMDTLEMKDKGMRMDTTKMKVMMNPTHHLMLHITNAANGQEIDNLIVKSDILTPSKKTSTIELEANMMTLFGSCLMLDEKGNYLITINVKDGSVFKETHFEYTVK
jgi:hypothetical protein